MNKPKRTDDKYWTGTRNFDHIQYETDLENYIDYLEAKNVFYFDCWSNDGILKTKTIEALNIENAKIIFEAKYPDYQYDEPY